MEAAGKTYIQHSSKTDKFTIWGIGDMHLGVSGCEIGRIKRDVKAIEEDPYSYWFGLGDYGDYITYLDKRFDFGALDQESKENLDDIGFHTAKRVRDLLMPIRHKCLGMLLGNHEAAYMKHNTASRLHSWLCTELGAQDLKYSAIKDIVFVRKKCKEPAIINERGDINESTARSFRCFLHHGAGGSVTPGGKLKRLLDFMNMFPDCDIYFMGHVHDQIGKRLPVISADANCSKLTERQKIGVICGSYLKTYSQGVTSYGEVKGYAPTSLGASRVFIHPETRELRAEV